MSDPMPLQMAKGHIAVRLEDRYRGSRYRRAMSLYYLLNAGVAGGTFYNVGATKTLTLTGPGPGAGPGPVPRDDVTHFQADWFGPNNFFVTLTLEGQTDSSGNPILDSNGVQLVDLSKPAILGPLPAANAARGEPTVRAGLIAALSASLGFDQAGEDRLGARADETAAKQYIRAEQKKWLKRDVDIFWFCGKGDEFECMVSWNKHQVNLFIMTPPLKFEAGAVTGLGDQRTGDAPSTDDRGLLLVRTLGPKAPSKALLGFGDGGVSVP
jgi:hypothetical protein